jgi:hypothetical protein
VQLVAPSSEYSPDLHSTGSALGSSHAYPAGQMRHSLCMCIICVLCMYACICTRILACISSRADETIARCSICYNVCMYVCIHYSFMERRTLCKSTVCVCMHVCVHISPTYIHTYIFIHTYSYINACIYIYIYIYTHTYIHTHKRTWPPTEYVPRLHSRPGSVPAGHSYPGGHVVHRVRPANEKVPGSHGVSVYLSVSGQ